MQSHVKMKCLNSIGRFQPSNVNDVILTSGFIPAQGGWVQFVEKLHHKGEQYRLSVQLDPSRRYEQKHIQILLLYNKDSFITAMVVFLPNKIYSRQIQNFFVYIGFATPILCKKLHAKFASYLCTHTHTNKHTYIHTHTHMH